MTLKTAQELVTSITPEEDVRAPAPATMPPQPTLPTFDLEVGWRSVYNPETNQYDQLPLTLLDVLYPLEDEAIRMPQTPDHDLWTRLLIAMLENFRDSRDWLILRDVFVNWGRRGVPTKAPDVAVIPGGRRPERPDKSYHVPWSSFSDTQNMYAINNCPITVRSDRPSRSESHPHMHYNSANRHGRAYLKTAC